MPASALQGKKPQTFLRSGEHLREHLCKETTKKTKVAVPGTRTVQPPPKWEMKCDWVTDMIPQCRVRRSSVQHVLHFCFLSDRVPAGRVHGPGSQVRARPGGEVLQIRSAQVESGKKCGSPTNSRITMMDVLIQTKQQMNETVSFPTNGCTIVTKNRTHCAEVPTQIDCQERTVFNH